MKPQPMSDAEIADVVSSAFADDSALSESERVLVQAIIAARDAQWAAMIGEPVAGVILNRDGNPGIVTGHDVAWHVANRGASPLYAIKETP